MMSNLPSHVQQMCPLSLAYKSGVCVGIAALPLGITVSDHCDMRKEVAAGRLSYDLESCAPKLALKHADKTSQQIWEVRFRGGGPNGIYIDIADVVRVTNSWAEIRCRMAAEKRLTSALPTLVVSGLYKTGKSYTLDVVVPAVLAEVVSKEAPDHPLKGILVLQLNGLDLQRNAGGSALLRDLLREVMDWAITTKVPVKAAAWHRAQEVLADAPDSPDMLIRAGRALLGLFNGFQAPVLVLLDELQALLQPTDTHGELDWVGMSYIRDNVLRKILVDGPNHVLWAVTGSSMALVWMSLAAMPPNGTAPLQQIRPVHLPSIFPPSLWQELLGQGLRRLGLEQQPLQEVEQQQKEQEKEEQQREQVKELLERSGGSPALFMTMVDAWDYVAGRPEDTNTFVDNFIADKLYVEVLKEWMLSLAHTTDEARGLIRDLANVTVGAHSYNIPDRGLWRFLQPHLKMTENERYYLADPIQRQLLRAVVDQGGNLRENWTGLGSGLTLVQLDWGWLLLQLGEVADYLVGQRRRHEDFPSNIDGIGELAAMIKELADKVEAKLPKTMDNSVADRWEALLAFKKVLESTYNTGSRAWYQLEGKKQLQSHHDYLVFFLWLSRNVLVHQKPWDGRDLVDFLQLVVMALPEMVDMHVPELAEQVHVGMSKLAPATLTAAAAAADAADGDKLGRGKEGKNRASASSASVSGSSGSVSGSVSSASASGGSTSARCGSTSARCGSTSSSKKHGKNRHSSASSGTKHGKNRGGGVSGGGIHGGSGSAAAAIWGHGLRSCTTAGTSRATALCSGALARRLLVGKAVVPCLALPVPVRLHPVHVMVAPPRFT